MTTAITTDDGTASLELAMEVIGYFKLSASDAQAIVAEVSAAVATWRAESVRLGLSHTEIERMASAFIVS